MIVEKFTPEALVSAPRRGPAIPNHDGTLAFYTESTYTGGKSQKAIHLLNIATGTSSLILRDDRAYEPSWLDNGTNTIVYLRGGCMGLTFVLAIDVDRFPLEPLVAGHVSAPVQCLKTRLLGDGTIAFTVLGYVGTDGRLRNTDHREVHGGRVYSSSQLRNGDLQRGPHAYSVWYSVLERRDGVWRIIGDLHNALAATNLHISHETGFYENQKDQYDLCENGITVAAEHRGSPRTDPSDVYFVRVQSFGAGISETPKKIEIQSKECRGICTLPQFSPDGSMIGFLRAEGPNSETSLIYIYHTLESESAISVFDMVTGRPWPLTPNNFRFSADGHSLYVTAEDCGHVGLYHLDLLPNAYPRTLLRNGAVSAFYPLGQDDRVLVTASSFVENCRYQIVSHEPAVEPFVLSSASNHGAKLGLSPKQISDIYFEGGGNYIVHAWIVMPRHFDETKKYPLAILVHDNILNSSWLNAWDMKWNAAAWSEQGYVVVLPNITGSAGYGQDFATAIHDDWGGRPYDDLVSCMYNLRGVPGIDVDNAVIAGAGYGGYLMNWIQGHPLAKRFKAMVCHAGIFNTQSTMLRSNPLGLNEYPGGLPTSETNLNAAAECYNPAQSGLLGNWKTPMLVIHNERDPVSPVSEGLAAYNNLQSSGVASKFLTFTDEGHEVVQEANSLEWHRHVFDWVNRYTGITPGLGNSSDNIPI